MKNILFIITIFIFYSCNNTEKVDTKKNEPTVTKDEETVKDSVKNTQVIYSLNNVSIELYQSRGNGIDYFCNSKIITKLNNEIIDSVVYQNIDPVGSDFGISKGYQYKNNYIFSKYGDYDGETIIINSKGTIKHFIGGMNYLDTKNDLLFTTYISDLFGFAVYDFKKDSVLFKMIELEKEPIDFCKKYKERYFIKCENNETGKYDIWEIKLDLKQIMQIDLDIDSLNKKNQLKKISISAFTNCICEDLTSENNQKLTNLENDTFVSKGNQVVFIAPTEKELDYLLNNDTTNIENDIYDDFSHYANKLYSEYEDSQLSIVLPTETIIEIIAFDGTKSYLNKKEINEKYGYIINSSKREPIVEFGIFTDDEIIKEINLE